VFALCAQQRKKELQHHVQSPASILCVQVFRSFAVDAVSSMASSCKAVIDADSSSTRAHAICQLVLDSTLSIFLTSLNSITMMTQAIIYAVALNSGRNEVVALMIATQFMEVKVSHMMQRHMLSSSTKIARCHQILDQKLWPTFASYMRSTPLFHPRMLQTCFHGDSKQLHNPRSFYASEVILWSVGCGIQTIR
jgi:hypothetical protein